VEKENNINEMAEIINQLLFKIFTNPKTLLLPRNSPKAKSREIEKEVKKEKRINPFKAFRLFVESYIAAIFTANVSMPIKQKEEMRCKKLKMYT
jgi:hypothetical protein